MKGQFTGLNVGTIKRIYIEPVTRRDWTLNEVSVMLFSVKDFVITQCKIPKKGHVLIFVYRPLQVGLFSERAYLLEGWM